MPGVYLQPKSCVIRLSESSLSPWWRTAPEMGMFAVEPGIILPFSSTFAIAICTEAWSFASMRRPVAAHLRGT